MGTLEKLYDGWLKVFLMTIMMIVGMCRSEVIVGQGGVGGCGGCDQSSCVLHCALITHVITSLAPEQFRNFTSHNFKWFQYTTSQQQYVLPPNREIQNNAVQLIGPWDFHRHRPWPQKSINDCRILFSLQFVILNCSRHKDGNTYMSVWLRDYEKEQHWLSGFIGTITFGPTIKRSNSVLSCRAHAQLYIPSG